MNVVFDTYAWIEYFRGSGEGRKVMECLDSSDVITPVLVLLELSYKSESEGWDIKEYLNFIKTKSKIVSFDDNFVLKFGKVYNDVKKKVKGIGFADISIFLTAMLNDARILTGDPHFKEFDNTIFLGGK